MKRSVVFRLLLTCILLLPTLHAEAQDNRPISGEQYWGTEIASSDELRSALSGLDMKHHDIIFHGKVHNIEWKEFLLNGRPYIQFRYVTYKIDTLLKGNWPGEFFTVGCTFGNKSVREYNFVIGQESIVFAKAGQEFSGGVPDWCSVERMYQVINGELHLPGDEPRLLVLTKNFTLDVILHSRNSATGETELVTGKRVQLKPYLEAFRSVFPLSPEGPPLVQADPAGFKPHIKIQFASPPPEAVKLLTEEDARLQDTRSPKGDGKKVTQ